MTTVGDGSARWASDPTGRFAQRYWDGTTWTASVAGSGGGAASNDPLQPGETFPSPDQAASTPQAVPVAPAVAPDPMPAPTVLQSSTTPEFSGPPAGWYQDPGRRYESRYWTGTTWSDHVSNSGQQFQDPLDLAYRNVAPVPLPSPRTAEKRRRRGPAVFGPGLFLGALGALAAVLSLFLSWRDPGVHPSGIPVAFLWHSGTRATDPSLLILLIPIAIILIVGIVSPLGAGLRVFGAVVMLVVAAAFAYQVNGALPTGTGLGDVLETGFYVWVIGGLFALASGFVPSGWRAGGTRVVDDRVL
jgi:hypothetical protein